jgi:hypothetical protein
MNRLLPLLCLALAACTSAPEVITRPLEAVPLYVDPRCFRVCEASPPWAAAADGTGDWDSLGADQAPIERQKAACEAARQACADALQRLDVAGVIALPTAETPVK